jgi:hypothetical protein
MSVSYYSAMENSTNEILFLDDHLYQITITGTGSEDSGPYKLLQTEFIRDEYDYGMKCLWFEHHITGKQIKLFRWDYYYEYFSLIDMNTHRFLGLEDLKDASGVYDRFKMHSHDIYIKDVQVELHRCHKIFDVLRSFRQISIID